MRDAAHAKVLGDGAGAIRVHRDFRHVTVMVGIGHAFITKQVLAEGLEGIVLRDKGGIRLVLFTGKMGVPGRQAGATGDPQALCLRGVNVVVLHQAQSASGLVLVKRQHRNGRR